MILGIQLDGAQVPLSYSEVRHSDLPWLRNEVKWVAVQEGRYGADARSAPPLRMSCTGCRDPCTFGSIILPNGWSLRTVSAGATTPIVVVVGARVAGASVAPELARAGRHVVVVDSASSPSGTMWTHVIWPGTVVELGELGGLDELRASGFSTTVRYPPSIGSRISMYQV